MIYVADLRRDLAERAGEIQEELERMDALQSELALINAALFVLPLAAISQLELQDKAREEGGSKRDLAPTPNGDAPARKRRPRTSA